MLKNKGVYTCKCPGCGRSIIMHILDSDGSISPNMCEECHQGFEGIDKGEERNTFVIIGQSQKSTPEPKVKKKKKSSSAKWGLKKG